VLEIPLWTNRPLLAVNCVVVDHTGRLLLIGRKNQPFQGQ
jgi:ADP-ribose pyrophosphatase YjhB (NUDIX family)